MAKAQAKKDDNVVELRGHNSTQDEENRKVLFFMHRNDYVALLAAKKAADAALKNHAKLVKAELGEHGLAQIKLYEKSRTPEGEAKIKAEMEAMRQAARWAGIPVNTQFDMFEDLAPLDERAFEEGEESGLRGESLRNPYGQGSTAYEQFEEGWKKGQAKLGEGIKKKQVEGSGVELIVGDADDDVVDEDED